MGGGGWMSEDGRELLMKKIMVEGDKVGKVS